MTQSCETAFTTRHASLTDRMINKMHATGDAVCDGDGQVEEGLRCHADGGRVVCDTCLESETTEH